MREPRYSLLADIQYDIELARQGKFALYGQRNIAREYRCKKATPEEQQAYETLQNVLFMVPQWSDTEELHSDMERIGGHSQGKDALFNFYPIMHSGALRTCIR